MTVEKSPERDTMSMRRKYDFAKPGEYQYYNQGEDGKKDRYIAIYSPDGRPDEFSEVFDSRVKAQVYVDMRDSRMRVRNPDAKIIIPNGGRRYGVLIGYNLANEGGRWVPYLRTMNTETEANLYRFGFEEGWIMRGDHENALKKNNGFAPTINNRPRIYRFYHEAPAKRTSAKKRVCGKAPAKKRK